METLISSHSKHKDDKKGSHERSGTPKDKTNIDLKEEKAKKEKEKKEKEDKIKEEKAKKKK